MAKSSSHCGLVAVAYLPHGTMTLDPNRTDLPDGAQSIHSTCMKISQRITDLNPDLIILSTPHGLNIHQAVNIYQPGVSNCKAAGNAEWNHQWTDYSVEVELDGAASLDLYLFLQREQHRLPKIEGMLAFGGASTPLRWGEVVPLYFGLNKLASKQTDGTHLQHVIVKSRPKVVIIAQPRLGVTPSSRESYRHEQSSLLVELGRAIRSWCNSSSYRIIVIISGDQSHTHPWSPDLPSIYQPDPSCFSIFPQSGNEYSQPFDQAIHDWIMGKRTSTEEKLYRLDAKLLIDEAGKLEEFAFSCGYTGSLTMQGLMENETIESTESVCSSADWLLTDFVFCHPTYFGMMAAFYVRNLNAKTVRIS